jgi:hypothetical protein
MAEGSNPKAARQNGRVEAEAVAVPLPKDGAEPDAAIHAQVKEDRAATGDLPSDEASNAKDHSPDDTEHVHKGEKHTHHAPTHSEVPVAGTYLAKVATLGSRWHAVNWACASHPDCYPCMRVCTALHAFLKSTLHSQLCPKIAGLTSCGRDTSHHLFLMHLWCISMPKTTKERARGLRWHLLKLFSFVGRDVATEMGVGPCQAAVNIRSGNPGRYCLRCGRLSRRRCECFRP